MYALSMEEKLKRAMEEQVKEKRHMLSLYIERLKGLSPIEKLNQGYGFVTDRTGAAVRDVSALSPGDSIYVDLKNGTVKAGVEEITKRRK